MKRKKILLTSLFATSAVVATTLIQFAGTSNTVTLSDSNLNADTASGLKDLSTDTTTNGQVSIPSSYYQQNDLVNLSNDNGPILLFDDAQSFGATDWYGDLAWYITLGSDGYYSESWFSTSTISAIDFSEAGSKVIDWTYNHNTDNLYVLTDTGYLIIVSSKSGLIISAGMIGNNVNKIQIIDFDKSVYLWDSTSKNPTIYTIDPQTGKVSDSFNNSSSLSDSYLIALVPLSVNYSIAVTSTSLVEESTDNTSVNLTLTFVNDDMTKSGTQTQTVSFNDSIKGSDIFVSGLARTSDYVIFVGNHIYSVVLNTSNMANSSFTELSVSDDTALDNINSVMIDTNEQIYFKTINSSTIYTLSVSNSFGSIQINTSGSSAIFNTTSANAAQIFAVPISTESNLVSYSYIGYVLSPTDFTGTGIKNQSVITTKYTSSSQNPQFLISGVTSSSVPSGVNESNIVSSSSISGLELNNADAVLIADDYTGYLYVKVPYIIRGPWYSSSSSTVSSGYLIGRFSYTSVCDATTWASQSTFSSLFGTYEPDQITTEMLKKQATSIVIVPSSISQLTDNQLDINFAIVATTTNSITITATVSYVNAYGLAVSYQVNTTNDAGKTYTVATAASDYNFLFAGETSNDTDKVDVTSVAISDLYDMAQTAVSDSSQTDFLSVDISSLGATYSTYANTLPSLWQVSGINSFIVTSDKYPSNPVISVLAADNITGSIIILVQYNNLSNSTPSKFAIKYSGVVNYTGSTIKFSGSSTLSPTNASGNAVFSDDSILDLTTVSGFSDYGTKLTSDITAIDLASVYSSPLITSMGFTPTVTIVDGIDGSVGNSSLDEEYGSLLLKLDFSESVSTVLTNSNGDAVKFSDDSNLANRMGLTDGVVYQRYVGLLPIGNTFGITLDVGSSAYNALINDNNVNATISFSDLLGILLIKGYDDDEVQIYSYSWSGENLIFTVHAQSKTYDSVSTTQTFNVSWSPKFANVRRSSLIIAVVTSIVGVALVAIAVSLYITRRNKIRKLLK